MLFPLELVSLFATGLRGDPCSLSRLCQTHSVIHHLVVPVLYEDVSLPTEESVESFSHTINKPSCQFGTHTRILNLGRYYPSTKPLLWQISTTLVHEFRLTLQLLHNLQELVLYSNLKQFGPCFEGLEVPFTLQKLRIPTIWSEAFLSFIAGQPSIKDLHLSEGPLVATFALRKFFSAKPGMLPQLNSITADHYVVQSMVLGRPVTEAIITSVDPQGNYHQRLDPPARAWRNIYCKSAVPITTAGCTLWPDPRNADFSDHMITALRNNNAHVHVRKLKIVEMFRAITNDPMRFALARRVEKILTLTDFEQLEVVEVALENDKRPSNSGILDWLGDMGRIAAWKQRIPSLKRVSMCDVDLV